MARKLSPKFIEDLKSGQLKEILEFVKSDHTLDIEIRENYINIYYRGGNILKIEEKNNGYEYSFDDNYADKKSKVKISNKSIINKYLEQKQWYDYFAYAKQAMNQYFSVKSNLEREFQQLVVRENNYSQIAQGTDYFILDIEYANREGARFDIIAMEWLSEATKRKLQKNYKPKLIIIEMKYGDGAISGSASMTKHFNDFRTFTSDKSKVDTLKNEMIESLIQKRDLGLIPYLLENNTNEISEFVEEIDFGFILANHDPEKSHLINEINKLDNIPEKEGILFFASNFYGYGLYEHNKYTYNDFINKFSSQIYDSKK